VANAIGKIKEKIADDEKTLVTDRPGTGGEWARKIREIKQRKRKGGPGDMP